MSGVMHHGEIIVFIGCGSVQKKDLAMVQKKQDHS
jgi:hypothetical protein